MLAALGCENYTRKIWEMLMGEYRDLESLVQLLDVWCGFFSMLQTFLNQTPVSHSKFFFSVFWKRCGNAIAYLAYFLHPKAIFLPSKAAFHQLLDGNLDFFKSIQSILLLWSPIHDSFFFSREGRMSGKWSFWIITLKCPTTKFALRLWRFLSVLCYCL